MNADYKEFEYQLWVECDGVNVMIHERIRGHIIGEFMPFGKDEFRDCMGQIAINNPNNGPRLFFLFLKYWQEAYICYN